MKMLKEIEGYFSLDTYSILLYLTISLSFPSTFKISMVVIILITFLQFYRFLINKVSEEYLLSTYFFLLVFSLPFFRSTHTLLLIINIFFNLWFFVTNKQSLQLKKYKSELYIFIFFVLILISNLIHKPILKGIDTYLYLAFYPVFFLLFNKKLKEKLIEKTVKVYISSVILSSFYLLIINLINDKISFSTNTFFSEPLGVIHVYFGIYVGLAAIFIMSLYLLNKNYINKFIDSILLFIFLVLLIYIGARTALIAVIILFIITLYKRIEIAWYKKAILLITVFIGLLFISYNSMPRARNGIEYIKKTYISFNKNDKEDIVLNSWRNMYKRALVIDYSVSELKEYYFLGIGLANITKRISDKIINDGYYYFKPMNTHNQYLHFLLGLGLFSFIFFLFILYHFLLNYPAWFYFLLFFMIVMLTESVLVRVKGISLFFLFYLLFSYKNKIIE